MAVKFERERGHQMDELLYGFTRRESIIERYTEIAGRILAIYIGTIAVEMIMQGMNNWLQRF